MTSPMATGSDANAFGGQYVVTKTGEEGSVRWNFSVPATGNYYVWCRVLATSATHDSFYATPQGAGMDVYDLAEGTWSPKWQWSVLTDGPERAFR